MKTVPAIINKVALQNACTFAIAHNLSFAFWRLPGKKDIGFIIGQRKLSEPGQIPDHSFVIAPFNLLYVNHISPLIFYSNQKLFYNYINTEAQILKNLLTKKVDEIPAHTNWYTNPVEANKSTELKGNYTGLVNKAVEEIKNKSLQKVVLARTKTVELADVFDPVDLFFSLAEGYKENMITFFSTPNEGTWISASPEVLLSCYHSHYKTYALAGTRIRNKNSVKSAFSEKELQEQSVVSDYIRNILNTSAKRYSETRKNVAVSGNLVHLKNEFHFNLSPNQNSCDLLKELHPTPAVCGYPKDAAFRFISDYEGFDRKLYSGFTGPYFNKNNFHFFVHIRCMKIFQKQGLLYAGAGITKDSDPEKEWYETESKMQSISGYL